MSKVRGSEVRDEEFAVVKAQDDQGLSKDFRADFGDIGGEK